MCLTAKTLKNVTPDLDKSVGASLPRVHARDGHTTPGTRRPGGGWGERFTYIFIDVQTTQTMWFKSGGLSLNLDETISNVRQDYAFLLH